MTLKWMLRLPPSGNLYYSRPQRFVWLSRVSGHASANIVLRSLFSLLSLVFHLWDLGFVWFDQNWQNMSSQSSILLSWQQPVKLITHFALLAQRSVLNCFTVSITFAPLLLFRSMQNQGQGRRQSHLTSVTRFTFISISWHHDYHPHRVTISLKKIMTTAQKNGC